MAPWLVTVGVLALVSLAGCASPAKSTGGAAAPLTQEQRAQALKRASAYCKKKGMVLRADRTEAATRSGQATSEVPFRCVKAG